MDKRDQDKKKDEAFWSILSGALELDVKKGHLKWTLMDLSRKSKVTRSLIYYYFGRSKINILKEAVTIVGLELGGFNEQRERLWKNGQFAEALIDARRICEKLPYITQFMIEHRSRSSEVGQAIVGLEKRYLAKLNNYFPSLSSVQHRALLACFWGLCFGPSVDEEVIHAAFAPVLGLLKARL